MPKYKCYAKVVGNKYIGEVIAANCVRAEEAAWNLPNASASFCHKCSKECSDAVLDEIEVVLDEEDTDQEYVDMLLKMTAEELLRAVIENPYYLTDSYYGKFKNAIYTRAKEVLSSVTLLVDK